MAGWYKAKCQGAVSTQVIFHLLKFRLVIEARSQTSPRFQARFHRAVAIRDNHQRFVNDGYNLPVILGRAPNQKLIAVNNDPSQRRPFVKPLRCSPTIFATKLSGTTKI